MTVDFKREQQQNIFKALKKSMTETNTIFVNILQLKIKGKKKALKNFCKVKFEIRDNSLLKQKKRQVKTIQENQKLRELASIDLH